MLASVAVAAVACVATAVLTADATRQSAEREQVRVADVDQGIVDRLEAYGRGRAGWAGAGSLLGELAASSERLIVVTDLDGVPLVSSGSDVGDTAALDGDPTAVLDPLADVVAAAARTVPATPDTLALPAPLLEARAGGDRFAALARDSDDVAVGLCTDVADGDGPVPDDGLVVVLTACRDLAPGGAPASLVALENAVALGEHACLERRGVSAQLVRHFGAEGTAAPDLLTVHVPAAARGTVSAATARAWQDCATAVLTRELAGAVAPSAVLYVSETREVERSLLDRIGGRRILVALSVILAAAVLASLLASRRVLRPVRRLTAATQEMAAGRLGARVPVTGHDEVARLGRSFNEMAEALSDADEQRRRMVSDVAHELRTPLSNLRGYLEAGQDGVLPRDDAWTGSLLEETAVLQHLVDDLAVLAEADAGTLRLHRSDGDVVATVEAAVLAMRAVADGRSVRLVRSGVPVAAARHDPIRVRQVVSNLLSNAVRHSSPGGVVTVDVTVDATVDRTVDGTVDRTVGGALEGAPRQPSTVVIEVADEGTGIAGDHPMRVFERFYRADPSRSRETGGSGLGLSIVQQLVEAHGGSVSARNRAGGGAVFTVRLPVEPDA